MLAPAREEEALVCVCSSLTNFYSLSVISQSRRRKDSHLLEWPLPVLAEVVASVGLQSLFLLSSCWFSHCISSKLLQKYFSKAQNFKKKTLALILCTDLPLKLGNYALRFLGHIRMIFSPNQS